VSAAQGPLCAGKCRKRVSKFVIPRCPKCRVVLCLKCTCPNRCFTGR
jgi:hypothetical protein